MASAQIAEREKEVSTKTALKLIKLPDASLREERTTAINPLLMATKVSSYTRPDRPVVFKLKHARNRAVSTAVGTDTQSKSIVRSHPGGRSVNEKAQQNAEARFVLKSSTRSPLVAKINEDRVRSLFRYADASRAGLRSDNPLNLMHNVMSRSISNVAGFIDKCKAAEASATTTSEKRYFGLYGEAFRTLHQGVEKRANSNEMELTRRTTEMDDLRKQIDERKTQIDQMIRSSSLVPTTTIKHLLQQQEKLESELAKASLALINQATAASTDMAHYIYSAAQSLHLDLQKTNAAELSSDPLLKSLVMLAPLGSFAECTRLQTELYNNEMLLADQRQRVAQLQLNLENVKKQQRINNNATRANVEKALADKDKQILELQQEIHDLEVSILDKSTRSREEILQDIIKEQELLRNEKERDLLTKLHDKLNKGPQLTSHDFVVAMNDTMSASDQIQFAPFLQRFKDLDEVNTRLNDKLQRLNESKEISPFTPEQYNQMHAVLQQDATLHAKYDLLNQLISLRSAISQDAALDAREAQAHLKEVEDLETQTKQHLESLKQQESLLLEMEQEFQQRVSNLGKARSDARFADDPALQKLRSDNQALQAKHISLSKISSENRSSNTTRLQQAQAAVDRMREEATTLTQRKENLRATLDTQASQETLSREQLLTATVERLQNQVNTDTASLNHSQVNNTKLRDQIIEVQTSMTEMNAEHQQQMTKLTNNIEHLSAVNRQQTEVQERAKTTRASQALDEENSIKQQIQTLRAENANTAAQITAINQNKLELEETLRQQKVQELQQDVIADAQIEQLNKDILQQRELMLGLRQKVADQKRGLHVLQTQILFTGEKVNAIKGLIQQETMKIADHEGRMQIMKTIGINVVDNGAGRHGISSAELMQDLFETQEERLVDFFESHQVLDPLKKTTSKITKLFKGAAVPTESEKEEAKKKFMSILDIPPEFYLLLNDTELLYAHVKPGQVKPNKDPISERIKAVERTANALKKLLADVFVDVLIDDPNTPAEKLAEQTLTFWKTMLNNIPKATNRFITGALTVNSVSLGFNEYVGKFKDVDIKSMTSFDLRLIAHALNITVEQLQKRDYISEDGSVNSFANNFSTTYAGREAGLV